MSEKIKPIGKRIVVLPIEITEVTKSGLYIPENAKEKPQEATVIEVGNGVTDIVVGETVIYGKYAGTEISRNDTKYIILKVDDVLAVVS